MNFPLILINIVFNRSVKILHRFWSTTRFIRGNSKSFLFHWCRLGTYSRSTSCLSTTCTVNRWHVKLRWLSRCRFETTLVFIHLISQSLKKNNLCLTVLAPPSKDSEVQVHDWLFINYTYKRFDGLTAKPKMKSSVSSLSSNW